MIPEIGRDRPKFSPISRPPFTVSLLKSKGFVLPPLRHEFCQAPTGVKILMKGGEGECLCRRR